MCLCRRHVALVQSCPQGRMPMVTLMAVWPRARARCTQPQLYMLCGLFPRAFINGVLASAYTFAMSYLPSLAGVYYGRLSPKHCVNCELSEWQNPQHALGARCSALSPIRACLALRTRRVFCRVVVLVRMLISTACGQPIGEVGVVPSILMVCAEHCRNVMSLG